MNASTVASALVSGEGGPAGAVVGVQHACHRALFSAGDRGSILSTSGPVTADTVFDLASVTKVVATTCALHRLFALGEISLSDPLLRYLPQSSCHPNTTLSTLAHHRAGLWEWQPLYLTSENPDTAIRDLPLRYPFDKERHYSDLGFMLLGRAVESVTGEPLDRAVAELVTAPLGLLHTRYGPIGGDGPIESDVASSAVGDGTEERMVASGDPYPIVIPPPLAEFAWREGEITGEANDGNAFHAFGGVAGHAGLFSTAGDLLSLLGSLGCDDSFWGVEASRQIFTDGPDSGQAFGWRSWPVIVEGQERTLLWHPGFTGCAVGFVPGAELSIVMLTNRLLAEAPQHTITLWNTTMKHLDCLDLLPAPPPSRVNQPQHIPASSLVPSRPTETERMTP